MKRISLITAGLFAAFSMSAQVSVVKEAEGLMKQSNFGQAVQTIKPALTNPETQKDPKAWFVAGKSSIGLWDNFTRNQLMGQAAPEAEAPAARALLDAYGYLVTALPLDQIPDEKGKVKPKYTKDIMKLIGENYQQYMNAGLSLYNNHDYDGAYKLWDLYLNLPNDPNADHKAFKADPDTIVGQITYYQGLAAYFNKDYAKAVEKVKNSLAKGFQDKTSYILGLDAANNCNDKASAMEFARTGNKLYGADDVSFLATIINDGLQSENYGPCYEALNESMAIAANDSIKSSVYNILAIVNERENKIEEAKKNLNESIKLNPSNAKSYFDMGRLLQNQVAELEDTADDATRANVLAPQLIEAAKYYEKSFDLDDSQTDLPGHIYRLYYALDQNYHLGNEYAQKASYWEKLK